MEEIRSSLAPDTPVEVWFQHEMRVGQKNKLTYRWAKARWDWVESASRFMLLIEHDLFGKPLCTFPDHALVLLHHKFRFAVLLPIGAAQHGHRDKDLMMTTINRRRTVAMEFGM